MENSPFWRTDSAILLFHEQHYSEYGGANIGLLWERSSTAHHTPLPFPSFHWPLAWLSNLLLQLFHVSTNWCVVHIWLITKSLEVHHVIEEQRYVSNRAYYCRDSIHALGECCQPRTNCTLLNERQRGVPNFEVECSPVIYFESPRLVIGSSRPLRSCGWVGLRTLPFKCLLCFRFIGSRLQMVIFTGVISLAHSRWL